jgi:nickel transport protein
MKSRFLAHLAVVGALLPGAAAAHGVRADVERRGAEISVRARYEGGKPLAGARFQVVSPARPGEPFASGLTDREGRAVFAPDAPGTWEVRIVDATGHGKVVEVAVAPGDVAGGSSPTSTSTSLPAAAPTQAAAPTPGATPAPSASPIPTPSPARAPATGRSLALGVAVLGLIFGGVWLAVRRRAGGR